MNLIEGLQEEMNRCRDLLKEYEAIGFPGTFAASMIKQAIKKAENRVATGDTIGMMKSFKELEACN